MVTSVPPPTIAGTCGSGRSVLVVATVGAQTPVLERADWIRIDGALGTLEALADHRARHALPALFDIPGPRTRRTGSLLTTSEYLVFAAAEGYEWVNLRGVTHPDELLHAREFLAPATRLSVTISTPVVLLRALPGLCAHADAVLFARAELRRALGPHAAEEALRAAIRTAAMHAAPPLLGAGVLPSMLTGAQPLPEEVEQLSALVDAGLRGLVLTRETTHGRDPQGAIDIARLVAGHGRPRPGPPRDDRPSARLAGRMSVVRGEMKSRVRSSAP